MSRFYIVTVREITRDQFNAHQEGEALPEDFNNTGNAFEHLWETSFETPERVEAFALTTNSDALSFKQTTVQVEGMW